MSDLLEKWRLAPAVRALMAMKGFQTVAAMILVSELGEVHRFTSSAPGDGLSGLGANGEQLPVTDDARGTSPNAVTRTRAGYWSSAPSITRHRPK